MASIPEPEFKLRSLKQQIKSLEVGETLMTKTLKGQLAAYARYNKFKLISETVYVIGIRKRRFEKVTAVTRIA